MKNTIDKKMASMDFSDARPVSEISALVKLQAERKTKTRITMRIDTDIIEAFKKEAVHKKENYQTLINDALKEVIQGQNLSQIIRTTIREELSAKP